MVTGAARGIGAATVRGLAAAGWAVVAVDRAADDPRLPYAMGSEAELRTVVATPGHLAQTAEASPMPNGWWPTWPTPPTRRRWPAAVARAEELFGGLDAMVAGGRRDRRRGARCGRCRAEQLAAVLDVDLGGVSTAARAGIPALLRRPAPRDGRFIAVASAAATRGLPGLAAYGAAKAGVAGLVRGLAVDLADTGVTANAVSPGSTATAMLDESARLYGLPDAAVLRRPAAGRAPARPRGGGRAPWSGWPAPTAAASTGAVIPVDGGLLFEPTGPSSRRRPGSISTSIPRCGPSPAAPCWPAATPVASSSWRRKGRRRWPGSCGGGPLSEAQRRSAAAWSTRAWPTRSPRRRRRRSSPR